MIMKIINEILKLKHKHTHTHTTIITNSTKHVIILSNGDGAMATSKLYAMT